MQTSNLSLSTVPTHKFTYAKDLFSLTKPRLSSLVIFTCALGMFLAPLQILFWKGFISMLATAGLVGGGCIINCYMERDIDALMERTKNRPLPSGRVSPRAALFLGFALIIICLSILYFVINPLTAVLGFVAALVYLSLYTPLKTKTSWALFAGAIPGAIPPLMGWTSVTGELSSMAWALFAILFVWQLPHFLSISIYHAKDYNNAAIKILPSHIGFKATVHRIAIYTFVLMIVSLIPFYLNAAAIQYKHGVYFIGGTFFIFSLYGHFLDEKSPEFLIWARRYFFGSLVYLPLVFTLMLYFRK